MHRRSSGESSPSSWQGLHPVLQSTLASLDIQLDEELARYRRLRNRNPRATRRGRDRTQPSMMALDTTRGATGVVYSAQVVSPPPPPPRRSSPTTTAERSSLASLALASDLRIKPDRVTADQDDSSRAIASDLDLVHPTSSQASHRLGEPQVDEPLVDELQEPDDYLESSEELLKSITEEETLRAEQEPGLLESLLTPLGIGSMMLLILASATLGYLIMHPYSIYLFDFGRFFGHPQTPAGQSTAPSSFNPPNAPNLANQEFVDLNLNTLSTLQPTSSNQPSPIPSPQSTPTPSPQASPNPSVVNRTPSTAATPAAVARSLPATPPIASPTIPIRSVPVATAPSPVRQSRRATASSSEEVPVRRRRTASINPVVVAPPPSPRRVAPPPPPQRVAPAVSPEQSEPPSATSSVARTSTPSASSRYLVVTEYNGDQSLEQARQVVGDAYVRNFPQGGARVQLGSFSDPSRAQELIQNLQQQGIPAQVYNPK